MRAIPLSLVAFLLVCCGVALGQEGKNNAKADDTPKVRVTLLEAGDEPRQVLRYHPAAGSEETMVMSMKMGMSMNVGGNELPPRNMPTMEMVMDMKITEAAKDQFRYEFMLSKVSVKNDEAVPDEVREAMQEEMQMLVGLKGQGVMTTQGFSIEGSFTLPEDAPPSAEQMFAGFEKSINEMSTPLPEEAVGLGAKWEIEQHLETNGMQMKQTIVHELKALDGDEFSTKVNATQTAESQDVKAPGLPENVSLHLDSLTGKGKGQSTFKLTEMVPHSSLEYESQVKMTTVGADERQVMEMTTTMEMEVRPEE